MEGWLIIAFCVVAMILGVTVAKAFARHRRELGAVQRRLSSIEHRHNIQSVRVAALESHTKIAEQESAE